MNSTLHTIDLDRTKHAYIHIDSNLRNKKTSALLLKTQSLNKNSLEILKDSNELFITSSNHGLSVGDKISLTGIAPHIVKLKDGIEFITGSNLMRVFYPHNITPDDVISRDIYVNISGIKGNSSTGEFFNNIPLNLINTTHKIIVNGTISTFDRTSFHVELPYIFEDVFNSDDVYFNISVQLQSIAGIPLNIINARTPVDNNHLNGFHVVQGVYNESTFYVNLPITASHSLYENNTGGILNVIKSLRPSYPFGNSFTHDLEVSYTNVIASRIVSIEMPNTEHIINDSNNLIVWQNKNDGDREYSCLVDTGNYTELSLGPAIELAMNKVIPNIIFNIKILKETNRINFNCIESHYIPKGIVEIIPDIPLIMLPSETLSTSYDIKIYHPLHRLHVDDYIEISGSLNVKGIGLEYLNKRHKITSIIDNDNYLLTLTNINVSSIREDTKGGNSLIVMEDISFRLLFNRPNTIGSILGFRDVGDISSITNFGNNISNIDAYYLSDTVGSNIINLNGTRYISILSDILIQSRDRILDRIIFNSNVGDIMHNTNIGLLHKYETPIVKLNEIDIQVVKPDGELYDLNGIEWSMTIQIFLLDNINVEYYKKSIMK